MKGSHINNEFTNIKMYQSLVEKNELHNDRYGKDVFEDVHNLLETAKIQ